MSKLPKWMRAHITRCQAAFGVTELPCTIVLQDCIDDDPTTTGQAQVNFRYLYARILLRRDLPRDVTGYTVLTHEVLHLAQRPQDQAVEAILELVPRELRDHARSLWDTGTEQTTTQLARGLTPLLRAAERPQGD